MWNLSSPKASLKRGSLTMILLSPVGHDWRLLDFMYSQVFLTAWGRDAELVLQIRERRGDSWTTCGGRRGWKRRAEKRVEWFYWS